MEFDEGAIDWYEIFKETRRILPTKEDLGLVFFELIVVQINTNYTCFLDITTGKVDTLLSTTQKISKQ